MQNLIENSFIVIFFYHFQHLPTFLAEIVSVNSSLVPLFIFIPFLITIL